jgi:hypothetical protein
MASFGDMHPLLTLPVDIEVQLSDLIRTFTPVLRILDLLFYTALLGTKGRFTLFCLVALVLKKILVLTLHNLPQNPGPQLHLQTRTSH